MQYIIADIHGCYEEYLELMNKIELVAEDHLYILGDALDRGPEPMKVLLVCIVSVDGNKLHGFPQIFTSTLFRFAAS